MSHDKSKNRVVKYDPEINSIPLRKFSSAEMNLFFAIISEVQNSGTNIVRLYFDDLKYLSKYSATANLKFIDDLDTTYTKILNLRYGYRSKTGLYRNRFVLFSQFEIVAENTKRPYVDLKVLDTAVPLLNDLSRWVRYNLTDFLDVKSTYSKTMFRLLKEVRTTGIAYYPKETFYELLSVPSSYQKDKSNLERRVFTPIQLELSPFFPNLKIQKVYSSKRGHPIKGFRFTFKPEPKNVEEIKRNSSYLLKRRMMNLLLNNALTYDQKRKQAEKLYKDKGEDYLELERKGKLPSWAIIPKDEVNGQFTKNNVTLDDNIERSSSMNLEKEKQFNSLLGKWISAYGMVDLDVVVKQITMLCIRYDYQTLCTAFDKVLKNKLIKEKGYSTLDKFGFIRVSLK